MLRREQGLKCLNDYHILPFLDQDVDGEPYYRIDNSTLSFGYVGLNEMLLALFGEGIDLDIIFVAVDCKFVLAHFSIVYFSFIFFQAAV